jgi:RNA polymerase sigma factor for flagellar operon FliA
MTAAGDPRNPYERLFLEHLGEIDLILRTIARRHALSRDEADDFAGWARLRLIEDDYATLRKWEGRSKLATYLTVVLTREYSSYRNMQWGRWRPSTAAQRLGPVAIRLELLLSRDKCSLDEALAILRGAGVTETDAELRRMAAALPRRTTDREERLDDVEHDIAGATAKAPHDHEARERVLAALRSAIEAMPQDDRLLVQLYYWDGLSVADIARFLKVEQKPLYPRLKSIYRRLLEELRRRGISDDDIRDELRDDDE